jgi:hypothetical protein
MKKLATALVGLSLLLTAWPALAGAPLEGEYRSQLGDMLAGRFCESWAGGAQGQVGNAVHAQSWDGSNLGGEWTLSCPVLMEPPELISSNLDVNGTGMVEYRSVYSGGTLVIVGTGPWGAGDAWYTATLDYYVHNTTFIYWYGVQISYTTNADFSGHFIDYPVCLLGVTNAASVGQGGQPADYPDFLTSACLPDGTLMGEWGQVADITLSIFECTIGSESNTWGSIKTMYR